MNSTIPLTLSQKYSELISRFKCGNYLCVIEKAFFYDPSLFIFYYLSQSCKQVNAPLELIEYINYYILSSRNQKTSEKSVHTDLAAFLIPTVDQLLAAKHQVVDPLKAKRVAIECFLFDNAHLLIHRTKLSTDQARLLSNLMNILGDTYRLQGQLKAAFEALKLATLLFPDSFYSRVNYADLTYALNNVNLCLGHLRHANHLLYHSKASGKYRVYDPQNNAVVPVNELVLKNFYSLSCRIGFMPG